VSEFSAQYLKKSDNYASILKIELVTKHWDLLTSNNHKFEKKNTKLEQCVLFMNEQFVHLCNIQNMLICLVSMMCISYVRQVRYQNCNS
jgi:hypothetical protein